MDPSIAKPTVNTFFESATVGAVYTRCFLTVLVIMALLYALCQAWRMVQSLRLLSQAANADRAKETAAPYVAPQRNKEESGYWR